VSSVPVSIAVKTEPSPQNPEQMYLDLLKKVLTRAQVAPPYLRRKVVGDSYFRLINGFLSRKNLELVRLTASDPQNYLEGVHADTGRVEGAETMIGTRQLDNIQFCITDVLHRKVPGDLIEAGAWRGGVTIFMRAVLKAYGDNERRVWVADSFEGLPKNTENLREGDMAVSLDEVRENFARYGLLDENVHFLKGFFNATLPDAPISKLSILRADADLYESTMDVLTNLYPKLSVGGYAIFDDYFSISLCKRAIDEYREAHHITEEIKQIDSHAVYWMKQK
jgi:O-methyltransferase